MRTDVYLFAFLLAFASSSVAHGVITARQDGGLSSCVQRCHDVILPAFSCAATTDLCFCTDPSLSTLLDACVQNNCTFAEQLESQSFSAQACETPARNQSKAIKVLAWTIFSVATLFFIVRLAARGVTRNAFRADDWIIDVCYAALVGSTVCIHLATGDGLGAESYLFSIDQLSEMFMYLYAFQIMRHSLLYGAKIALVMLYLRILPSNAVSYAFRFICWFAIVILALSFVGVELATVLQCLPVSAAWNFVYGQTGRCLNSAILYRTSSTLDLIYSIILVFLPIPPLLAVRVSPVQRTALACIYTLGLAVVVTSIGRIIVTIPASLSSPNRNLTDPLIWSLLEPNLLLILISLPALCPLLHKEEQPIFETTSSSTDRLPAAAAAAAASPSAPSQDHKHLIRGISAKRPGEIRDEEVGSDSSELYVAVGGAEVTLQHAIPKEVTSDKFVYRDGEGRMHEVELVDRPSLQEESNKGGGEEGEKRMG